MMNITKKEIKTFQNEILQWYSKNKRDLPWRHGRNPYAILISEVMAQQTQLSRVIPKYLAWMERFPTLKDVADAPTSEILRYWSGLGYNRRALYLQRTAKDIIEKYEGGFPQTEKEFRQLPGIGEYTARAVLCFAFDKQIPVIDTNIKKVIAINFFNGEVPDKKTLEGVAQQLLPIGKSYAWNQALMDYAASVLKQHKIPIPKQSKFKGSDRYYRGQILKMLIEKKKLQLADVYTIWKENLSEERFQKILQTLEKDGFVSLSGKTIQLI